MKNILISPYSQKLRSGKQNPKNYPYWEELCSLLKDKGYIIHQLGVTGETKLKNVDNFLFDLTMEEISLCIKKSYTFICVDTWLQHIANYYGKRGYVIFSKSNPEIFGYKTNINILKSTEYLRPKQFEWWDNEDAQYNQEAFLGAKEVFDIINKTISSINN